MRLEIDSTGNAMSLPTSTRSIYEAGAQRLHIRMLLLLLSESIFNLDNQQR